MKLLTVLGARPQFIKAAALSRAFKSYRPDIEEILVHTGQHYDKNMSGVFFDELQIPRPDYNLGVGGGSHGQNTGRMLEKLEALAQEVNPDWVVVFGDTDSTLAGALTAAKLHIPVAHAEAGLRSFNRRMPEEINRVLTDHVSDILWCPTQTAQENLEREGIKGDRVQVPGDLMYDTALFYKEQARKPAELDQISLTDGKFALCTIHRAENVDSPGKLAAIFEGLAESPVDIVLPLHPRTRKRIAESLPGIPDRVHMIDPVGYLEMVWLEMHCEFVATDSGGVQKEAYFHGKPCITLREETEWVELVEHGWNCLAGTDSEKIARLLNSIQTPEQFPPLYGKGDSGKRMAESLS